MEWSNGGRTGWSNGGRTADRPRRPRISSADISCALAAARRAPSAPDRSRSEHPHSPVRRSRLGEYACLVTDMAVLWKEVGDTSRSRPRMRARRIRATADALTPLHSSHSACPIILMETFPREMNVLALFDPPDQAHLSLIHNQSFFKFSPFLQGSADLKAFLQYLSSIYLAESMQHKYLGSPISHTPQSKSLSVAII